MFRVGHRISHPGFLHILQTGGNISYHARAQLLAGNELAGAKVAHFYHFRLRPGGHHTDGRALSHRPVLDPAEYDHAFVRIIDRVKDQRFQRRIRIPLGRRDLLYHLFQHLIYIKPGLG